MGLRLLLLLGLLLGACAPAASVPVSPIAGGSDDPAWQQIVEAGKKEGKLLIYGRLLDGVEGTKYAEEFRKRYGIEVDFINGAGSAMFERVRNETRVGQTSADIYSGAFPWPETFRQENLLMSLRDKPLPMYKEPKEGWVVEPWYFIEGREYLAVQFSALPGHVSVNPKVLSPADYPRSYQQLMSDPKYKGKIAWVNPKLTGEIASRHVVNGYVGGGFWTLRDLHNLYNLQQPLMFPNPVDAVAAVTRGEAAIAMTAGSLTHLGAAEAGLLKTLRMPDIPLNYYPNAIGVLKTAKNPNAALVFMNWLFSKEGQDLYTVLNKSDSLRRDVPSRIPPVMNPEVPGGGKVGPDFTLTGLQVQLMADMHTAKVMNGLPEGQSYEDFERGYNGFMREWESKVGGPQKQAIPLVR